MNTATDSLPATFDDLLQKMLHCSRYARHLLEADRQLLNWLQKNYTTPCNRVEMLALLQQSGLDLTMARLGTCRAQAAQTSDGQADPA